MLQGEKETKLNRIRRGDYRPLCIDNDGLLS